MRKNMAESVLARSEAYRRGWLFELPPQKVAELVMPMPAPVAPVAADPNTPAVEGATADLVTGAVSGKPALDTLLGAQ